MLPENVQYIPLFNSSSLSRNSILTSKSIIDHALEKTLKMIAVCEKMNFFSMVDFSSIAKKNGIKPIFGCVINVTENKKKWGEIIVFIRNQTGFEEVSKLLSDSYINNQTIEDENYIDLDLILQQKNILVVIGKNNVLQEQIRSNNIDLCQDMLIKMKKKLEDRLYLTIDIIDSLDSYNNKRIHLGDILHIPLIYYHLPVFPKEEDKLSYYIFDCIINKKQYDEDVFNNLSVQEHGFLNEKDITSLCKIDEALENTYYLGLRCNFFPKKSPPQAPHFIDDPEEERKLFYQNAKDGLSNLIDIIPPEKKQIYWNRLSMELDIIASKDFAGYFLIVADFVQWAKNNGVLVGAGRGSGAGSIVAWSLGITDVDPIDFELFFERFLNPERMSMPDFDIDFDPKQRDKVLSYVVSKYGLYHCAHIITFGLMKAKMVVRDVGRVLGFSYYDVDRISKIIPTDQIRPVKLGEVLENDARLQNIYNSEPKVKKLIDISLKLEGYPRNISIHAAGFIISNKELYKYAPFYVDKEGGQTCLQLNMHHVEEMGLIKFDFLCLTTLTIFQEVSELVLKTRGAHVEFQNRKFDDEATYKLIGTGLCNGIFQLESKAIQKVVVDMQPDKIDDIIALISLFRPGPMAQIHHFIKRKHGEEQVEYIHPILEETLNPTYGVIVYQEQVMKITQVMASYTLGKADLVRKAMGKKKPEEMAKHEKDFIDGAVKNNIPPEIAKETFDQISTFAGYAFNKAHAAAYGIITYNTAYLKTHYMEEFYAVILNNEIHDSAQILVFITEFRKFGGRILNPNINKSDELFTVTGEKEILYGIGAIRGVGNYGKKIEEERKSQGEYGSFQDFLYRNRDINKKVLKALVYSGCFDLFEKNRCNLMIIGELFIQTKFAVKNSLERKRWSDYLTILREQEAFGFFLNRNPLDVYWILLKTHNIVKIGEALQSVSNRGEATIKCAAILERLNKRKSPTGKPYAFLDIMDGNHNLSMTGFSKVLEEKYDLLVENNLIIFTIHGILIDNQPRFTLRNVEGLEEFLGRTKYTLSINTENFDENTQYLFTSLLKAHKEKKNRNISIMFKMKYCKYYLDYFIAYNPNIITQMDELGINYSYCTENYFFQ